MQALLFLVVVTTTFVMFAHPVFVFCDRRLTQRRLLTHPPASEGPAITGVTNTRVTGIRRNTVGARRTRATGMPTFRESSLCLDDIARRLRLGRSPIDAFGEAVAESATLHRSCASVALDAVRAGDLRTAVGTLAEHSTGVVHEFARAVWVSHIGRSLSIAGLERAAVTHRDRWLALEELRATTAASRYSVRALTLFPIATLALSPLWGGSALSALGQSNAVRMAVCVGVALNIAGIAWCRRVTGSIT